MPAECDRESIYFLRLEIENAGCFAEKQVLSLADPNGRPARWTLLLGDNGVGKTTLLQSLAWMRPTPYYPPGEDTQAGIQPWLYDQDPPYMASLLRDGASRTTLQAEMVALPTLASDLPPAARIRTGMTLSAHGNALENVERTVNEPEETAEPFVITYAANRYMGSRNADELSDAEPSHVLSEDSTELIDAADVLSRLDYSALKRNEESAALLDRLKQALSNILPFIEAPSDIEIADPQTRRGELRFRTPYGDVPLHGLSLGHRTVTAWIIDLETRQALLSEHESAC